MPNTPAIGFAAVLVTVFAWERFNTPRTNRSMTTAFKYHLAAVWYVMAMLALFGAFTFMGRQPELMKSALSYLGLGQLNLNNEEFKDVIPFVAPFIAALILTTLLPSIPLLKTFDSRIRRTFQRMAAIPREVRDRSGELKRQSFAVPEKNRSALCDELSRDKEIDREDLVFERGDAVADEARETRYLWTKASAIFFRLRTDGRFSGFFATHASELDRIEHDYEDLQAHAKLVFKLERESGGLDAAASAFATTLASARAELRSRCRRILEGGETAGRYVEGIYDLVTRAILQVFPREALRREYLVSLGFSDDHSSEEQVSAWALLDRMASLFLTFFVLLLGGIFWVIPMLDGSGTAENESLPRRLVIVLMVSTLLCVSVICSLVVKRWSFARYRGTERQRPWLSYLLAAALAAGVGFLVRYPFMYWLWRIGGKEGTVWQMQTEKLAWLILGATLALVISFTIDDSPRRLRRRSPFLRRHHRSSVEEWLRLSESILSGAALAGAAILISMLLDESDPLMLAARAVVCGFEGLLLGFVVPHWYRASLERRSRQEAQSELIDGDSRIVEVLPSSP